MFNLAEKVGLLMAQLAEGRIGDVDIVYYGEVAKFDTTSLTMSVVKGLLTPMLQDTVNFVNAVSLAKDRSIKVKEEKSSESVDFSNLISLEVKTDKGKYKVSGTLFTKKDLRIARINDFYVEVIPEGHMLIINNLDKPGIIGNLGTLLGKHGINIAGMTFGRLKKGGEAITVLNIDSPVPSNLLDKIKKIQYIKGVKAIKL
jgi:D-3-phosphoglycerate dehydrogenase